MPVNGEIQLNLTGSVISVFRRSNGNFRRNGTVTEGCVLLVSRVFLERRRIGAKRYTIGGFASNYVYEIIYDRNPKTASTCEHISASCPTVLLSIVSPNR